MLTQQKSSKTQLTKQAFLKLIGIIVISAFLFVSIFACAQSTPTTSAPTTTAPTTAAPATTTAAPPKTTAAPATTTTAPTSPAAATTSAVVYNLKLSHIMSATSNPNIYYQYFADKIFERTKGKVKITVYAQNVLNPPAQGLDAVKTGVADIVHHSPNYTIGMQPSIEYLSVPLTVNNSWAFNQLANDYAAHFKFSTLKEFSGVHFCGICGPAGPYYLLTTKKQVKTPEDIKGLKMRGSGVMASMITTWGGTPVAMATGEVYESLSKGVIDGGLLAGEAIKGQKFGDVINYITITPNLCYGPCALLMNENTWNKLPADIQQVFNDTFKELIDWEGKVWWYSDVQGMDYYRALPGKQVYTIPAAEKTKWVDSLKPVMDSYIKQYANLGLPTADYVSYLQDRSDYWNSQTPDQKTSMDWVTKEILK